MQFLEVNFEGYVFFYLSDVALVRGQRLSKVYMPPPLPLRRYAKATPTGKSSCTKSQQ